MQRAQTPKLYLLFHFHKHVDPAHPIYLLYHLLILGTHSAQSKVKLRTSCVGHAIAVSHTNRSGGFHTFTATAYCLSFPPPQTPEFTSIRSFTLSPFSPFDGCRPSTHYHHLHIYLLCNSSPAEIQTPFTFHNILGPIFQPSLRITNATAVHFRPCSLHITFETIHTSFDDSL
jgi:hypothetical protein